MAHGDRDGCGGGRDRGDRAARRRAARARFLVLGTGYGVLALVFVITGSIRARRSHRALARDGFAPVPRGVSTGVTVYAALLIVLTVAALY